MLFRSSVQGKLSVVDRPDGTSQVTFNGMPLYSFVQDSPGQVTGDGVSDSFGGTDFTWTVASTGTSAPTAASPRTLLEILVDRSISSLLQTKGCLLEAVSPGRGFLRIAREWIGRTPGGEGLSSRPTVPLCSPVQVSRSDDY